MYAILLCTYKTLRDYRYQRLWWRGVNPNAKCNLPPHNGSQWLIMTINAINSYSFVTFRLTYILNTYLVCFIH